MSEPVIPAVLFVYARPDCVERILACMKADQIPLLYVFSDAAIGARDAVAVSQVRRILRDIQWCDCRIVERKANMGLGRSILDGVGQVFRDHAMLLVYEDDLITVPGTYAYLAAALRAYAHDRRVKSVTGWTHPDLVPDHNGIQPYFDGRSSSWLWGCWRRSWDGMHFSARSMVWQCRLRGIDPRAYGCDLYRLAKYERRGNTWAVRFMYNHIRDGALSLHPPHSLVEHAGFGEGASNHRVEKRAKWLEKWGNPPLLACPPVPLCWPEPFEQPGQQDKWQDKCGRYQPPPLYTRLIHAFSRGRT